MHFIAHYTSGGGDDGTEIERPWLFTVPNPNRYEGLLGD